MFEWKSIEDRQLGVMPVIEHKCVCSYEIVDVVYSSGSKPFWLVTNEGELYMNDMERGGGYCK